MKSLIFVLLIVSAAGQIKAQDGNFGVFLLGTAGYSDASNYLVSFGSNWNIDIGFAAGSDYIFFRDDLFRAAAALQYTGAGYFAALRMGASFQARLPGTTNYLGPYMGYNFLNNFGRAVNGLTFGMVNTLFIPITAQIAEGFSIIKQGKVAIDISTRFSFELGLGLQRRF